MKISKETYNLFLKHGSECLWINDSRVRRPKGTTEQTDKAFNILEVLDENMALFYNIRYSKKMKNKFAEIIKKLKPKVTDEVFILIESKYKLSSKM